MLFIPWRNAGMIGTKNNARHIFLVKVGDNLLQPFIAIEIDPIIPSRVVMQYFRRNFGLGATAKNDFEYPHGKIISHVHANVYKRCTCVMHHGYL